MPKTKKIIKSKEKEENKEEVKEIILDDEDKVIDPDVVVGDVTSDDEESEGVPDDEEVDPFKDRWEE